MKIAAYFNVNGIKVSEPQKSEIKIDFLPLDDNTKHKLELIDKIHETAFCDALYPKST